VRRGGARSKHQCFGRFHGRANYAIAAGALPGYLVLVMLC